MESRRYFPILKAKRGELAALTELGGDIRDQITPLLEVVPPAHNDGESPEESRARLVAVLRSIPSAIHKAWKIPQHFFLDAQHLPSDFRIASLSPLMYLWQECSALGLFPVPVLHECSDQAGFEGVRSCVEAGSQGIALRISQRALFEKGRAERAIERATSVCSSSRIDLILDLGSFSSDQVNLLSSAVENRLRGMARLDQWRTVVIAGTAFPEVSGVRPDSRAAFPRSEWTLWQAVRATNVIRDLEFGDYAIQHPKLPNSTHRPAPGIRYTTETEWVIFKGHKPVASRAHEEPQYPRLSQQLVADSIYCNPNFSAADRYIFDCAHGLESPGNPETWRRVGTGHHITFVTRQLANSASL